MRLQGNAPRRPDTKKPLSSEGQQRYFDRNLLFGAVTKAFLI
jgi:hypothetical protein